MDTSDFYKTSWAIDYLNFLKYSREQGMRPIHFEVGTSFTMAVTDDLNVHAWGINDCH
jgi:alpha-tubulin suppressor-like RCC1 family protein